MKKSILAFIALITVGCATAQTYKFPTGASTPITIAVSGTTAATVVNNMNHVASIPTLTANINFSVTAASQLKAGAIILLTVKTTSTETTTFSGSIVAPVVTGVAGKTWSQAYLYNGTNFYPMGAKIQVD